MALLHPENTRGGNRQSTNHLYDPIRPQTPLEIAADGPKHAPRRRLKDVTNLMPEIPNPNLPTADKNDYTQLLKENSALLRILSEKNRVIEQANLEVQKLRMMVSKLQTQNWQLAQANSQMLVELNMGKDKLKTLKHELGCTEQALRTKSLELEQKEKMGNKLSSEVGNEDERQLGACNESTRDKPHLDAEKLKLPKRKRTSDENPNIANISKEREMLNVSSTTINQVVEEEKGNKKQMQCKRSQASVSKSQVLGIKVQKKHAQPQNLLCQDQAVHTVSSSSSSSVDASNLEKDQNVGTAPPCVSKCGGEKSDNKRCTRNCPRNLKSDKDKPHLNESAQGIDQTAQFKSTSPCSTSIMIEGTEKRDHEEQVVAFSRGMEVQLHLNCNNADPCTDSAMTAKNEEQNQGVESVSSNEKEKLQNEEVRRSSGTGRPSRRATIGKSYKEKPLNVKMRRD